MIEMKSICKSYQKGSHKYEALKNLSMKVEEGEFLAIMGPSGSGKSTLLNILGGLDKVTSGEYSFNNTEVHKLSSMQLNEFRKNQIGFIFQDYALLDDCNVYENIEMPLIAHNINRKERKQRVMDMLQAFHITELAKKTPDKLSGGEQQRCAIARAIICDCPLILADEPTGALDSENGTEVMEILTELNREKKKTIIMVTHDEKLAAYADAIIHIRDGRICNEEKSDKNQ